MDIRIIKTVYENENKDIFNKELNDILSKIYILDKKLVKIRDQLVLLDKQEDELVSELNNYSEYFKKILKCDGDFLIFKKRSLFFEIRLIGNTIFIRNSKIIELDEFSNDK